MDTAVSSGENTDQEGEVFEDVPDSMPDHTTPKKPPSLISDSTPKASISRTVAEGPSDAKDDEPTKPGQNTKTTRSEDIMESPSSTAQPASTESLGKEKLDGDDVKETIPKEPVGQTKPIEIMTDVTDAKPPLPPSRFTGFSASLPAVPWANTSTKITPNVPRTSHSPSRKISSPFAWLNRAASGSKDGKSFPLQSGSGFPDRRNTAVSVSSVGSNPDLLLRTLDEAGDTSSMPGGQPAAKSLLRDRFKTLRLREEAGITLTDDQEKVDGGAPAGVVEQSTNLGLGIISPVSEGEQKEGGSVASPTHSPPSFAAPSTVNENLAPGTVSGIAVAAGDTANSIDWDFWQSVVNDGPQAVARTSPEELSQSIASGIPQTIRGVIWQVLASSKNEELEGVYRNLLLSGTDREAKDAYHQVALPNLHVNDNVQKKGSTASSASSIRSGHSTPATSTNAGVTSPTATGGEKDVEMLAKAQVQLTTERDKKIKDDAAALQKLEKMIRRDMGTRTSYSKYAVAAGFQEGLFNVCKAYALFDEGVGYPQGLNFIIMPLLFTMPEEEAFCLLVRLMNKYSLREMFVHDMPGLHLHLYQFERLLEDLEPALCCHLSRRGVSPKLYATQWFLTLFAYRLPLQLVMRVFDLVLSEGLEAAILKFGMALLQRNVSTLLAMDDMVALTTFLKEKLFDVYIDQTPSHRSILESGFFGHSGGSDSEVYRADVLVQDACGIKLTPDMLKRYSIEWAEKSRLERDRQADLENYRTTIAAQAIKVRSLEERAEKSDTEHVQIASDLVRLKMDNQELRDINESLRGQVEELKKVVESEGAAVETRLQGEMDRVMQRNLEVQNENRLTEESLAEMEADLVATKMKYAEITASHEILKQKWIDLRKALD